MAVASSIWPSASAMRIGAGGDRPLLDIDMGLDIDLDAEPGPLAGQKARRADAALAEMEVVADGDAADAEPADQIMVNEILCRWSGPALVEGHHHGTGKARPGQQAQLFGLVGEPELGGVRAEKLRGCGSKVTANAGFPCAWPIRSAASITARWPRWTPSKLPIATTAPRGIAAAGVVSRITVNSGVISRDVFRNS